MTKEDARQAAVSYLATGYLWWLAGMWFGMFLGLLGAFCLSVYFSKD